MKTEADKIPHVEAIAAKIYVTREKIIPGSKI